MSNPAAWTFWLKERQVTGVIVAEHRGEKLLEYGKRLYVVKGKDPGKRHYTQSTIPALWKKVINGQLQVEEEMKELGITKKDVKAARAHCASVRGKAKEATPTQAPSTAKDRAKSVLAPEAAQSPAPKKPPAASPVAPGARQASCRLIMPLLSFYSLPPAPLC